MSGSAADEVRHKGPDRAFHWAMAALVIVLLGTAFLPILGARFDWVPIHWISGVLLTAAILFHLYRAFLVHGVRSMLPTGEDLRTALGRAPRDGTAKYDVHQKLYHWSVAAVILVLVVSGCIMMAKIDTPLWRRDPSILSDGQWGVVYVCHGAASLLLIFFFILHVYFAFLPEHRRLLAAMALGRDGSGRGT
ncbi:MAG: cytochrome b/b6 domain-containing protein [Defluviicoccus sp.]|nr:cytochrome b/b6 domain-containing protein [Defluviicoccus sp.]MDE0383563.1 cytochrome b/b6 domain-containing protein [Defluviicoccus sp.]